MSYFCNAIAINMKRILIYTLLVFFAISCNNESFPLNEEHNGKIEVKIGQSININSRTSIDDDGHSAVWSKGDKIAIWAVNEEGNFDLEAETFSLINFTQTFDRAIFTASITPLQGSNYTYYASYPIPKSVSGTKATYTLASEQVGSSFSGENDIMVATPTQAVSLTSSEIVDIDFRFLHKMHALRITLPNDGKLDGNPIDRIEFSFPTEVVGDVIIDAADPTAPVALTNASRKLTITIPEGYKAGGYIWAAIFPTQISGDITYRVFAGEFVSKYHTISLNKTVQPSHISPMSIPIPDILKTTITIDITDNYLGEQFNTLTITDTESNTSKTLTANSKNSYNIYINGEITAEQLEGKVYNLRYESNHAIVENSITLSNITPYEQNKFTTVVPYLLFEDFTSIHTNFEKDDQRVESLMSADGMLLNDYMNVRGWNAAHVKGVAGQSLRVNVRHQSTMGVTRSNGRLDTPALKALKPNVSVKLLVQFDMGAYVDSGYGSNNNVFCMAGTHSQSEDSPINGVVNTKAFGNVSNDTSRVAGQFSSLCLTTSNIANSYTNDSFGATFPTYSFTATGCTSATRLCWIPCCNQSTWITSNNAHYYLYFDNIRVSIAQ